MARARNIKPAFFKNEHIADMPVHARLLFIGLWTLADREGRLQDRPRKICAEIFPYEAVDVSTLLDCLEHDSFITRYCVNHEPFIQISNWHKHQNPHHKEVESEIPDIKQQDSHACAKHESSMNHGQVNENASCPTDSLNLIPDSLIPDSLQSDSGSSSDEQSAPPQSKTPKQKLTKTNLVNEFEVDSDVAEAWLVIRNAKNSALTRVAMKSLINEFSKAGLSTPDGIRLCVEKGWVGFKASWDWQDKPSGKPKQSASTGFNERVYTSHTPAWAEEACDE